MAEQELVLIIDPVADTRSMTLYVAKQKYRVITADSVETAQSHIAQSRLALNGILVHVTDKSWLQFIRDNAADYPILALSPIATERAQQLLKAAGARLVLTAPVTGLQVSRGLKKLLKLGTDGGDGSSESIVA